MCNFSLLVTLEQNSLAKASRFGHSIEQWFKKVEDYIYSSARDIANGKGLIDLHFIVCT